jgi:hypothetical protein
MLTSYVVKCPHLGCDWFGSLLPLTDVKAPPGMSPSRPIVRFQCPQCQGGWSARIVGDDVRALPVKELAAAPLA